jgi:membrane protein implicated in regulation of membrane protease activity
LVAKKRKENRSMPREPTTPSYRELADELSTWLAGGGILTTALFPLALPLIALTVAAALPLVVVALAVGLVVAVVAAPILLLRRLVRASRRFGRSPSRRGSGAATAEA